MLEKRRILRNNAGIRKVITIVHIFSNFFYCISCTDMLYYNYCNMFSRTCVPLNIQRKKGCI